MIANKQLSLLHRKWPQAHIETGEKGQLLLVVPTFKLPDTWSPNIGTLLVEISPAFPLVPPRNFWIDAELMFGIYPVAPATWTRRKINGFPNWQNVTFFLWRLQAWNANKDTLLTLVHAVQRSTVSLAASTEPSGGDG